MNEPIKEEAASAEETTKYVDKKDFIFTYSPNVTAKNSFVQPAVFKFEPNVEESSAFDSKK